MTAKDKDGKKQMPKGGRKGGAIFPRITLEKAVGYAKRLVSKTHTGPQPLDIILSGVLDAKGGKGSVRMSALKQYGFTKGTSKDGFEASEEAKSLASAPPEELIKHYRTAALRPTIFKTLFDTFHGDATSHAKLKQRAAALNVHPDETDSCVDNYLASMQLAKLVTPNGDVYTHVAGAELAVEPDADAKPSEEAPENGDQSEALNETQTNDQDAVTGQEDRRTDNDNTAPPAGTPRAIFNVNVSLDSSLDTEKLEKQLALLKRYGAI